MEAERWARLDRIFTAAESLKGEERDAYVARECEGDAELRAQIERMLVGMDEAEKFVELAVAEGVELAVESEHSRVAGLVLGAYRIEKLLGQGGMGAVYLARRADGEFDKRVAIKMIRGGFSSDAMAARFRAERQMLAALDHPNCCRLIDGGISAQGAPYLVMEYVDGVRIDEYCETKGLDEAGRVGLCLQLVSALEAAHQKLIVHRDIKPGNVLVDQSGQVKLLDFGIAKLLGVDGREAAASVEILATPEFASPEQMQGRVVTTASDMYSLGKLMVALLPAARGELKAILNQAAHEEPQQRYGSMGQLGDDLRRYLNGFPVLAQPDSWWYRTRKFVRRNPVGTAAACVAILSMLVGVVATRREQLRAERRFDEVREIATSFLFEFHDSIEKLPGAIEARRLLVTRALKYLEVLSRDSGGKGIEAELASAYGKVSSLQWKAGASHVGDAEGALQSARREVELRERLQIAEPGNRMRKLDLAAALSRMAQVLSLGLARAQDAMEPTLRAVGLIDTVLREFPEDPEALEQAAGGHAVLGMLRMQSGDPKQALEEYRKAVGLRDTLRRVRPGDTHNQRMLGWMYVYAGDALGGGGAESHLGDRKGAYESTLKGERIFEELARGQTHNIAARRDLNVAQTRLAGVQEMMGNFEEALRWRTMTLAQALESVRQNPKDADAARTLYTNHLGMGLLLLKMGRYAESEAMIRVGMEFQAKRVEGGVEVATDSANLEHALGAVLRRRTQGAEAVRHFESAIRLREPILRGNGGDSRLRWRQAKSYQALGETLEGLQQRGEAAEAYAAALAIYELLQRTGKLSPNEAGTPAALTAKVGELRR